MAISEISSHQKALENAFLWIDFIYRQGNSLLEAADRLLVDYNFLKRIPPGTESGVFGGQVLALQLNVDFSGAAVIPAGLGDLYYCNPGDSLDGDTVAEILYEANIALGGGALPTGYDYSSLNDLVDYLNKAFDNCGELPIGRRST